MDTRTNGYGQTQGMRLLQELNAEGRFVFIVDDAMQAAERVVTDNTDEAVAPGLG